MQTMHSPQAQIRVPAGRNAISSFVRRQPKTEPLQLAEFIRVAHEFNSRQMASALKGFLSYPPYEDMRGEMRRMETNRYIRRSNICDGGDLHELAVEFVFKRNALIPYYMLSKKYSDVFNTPYQEVCKSLLEAGRKKKYDTLVALGMLGNALPENERMKLGNFISEFLRTQEKNDIKRAAFKALAFLFHQPGIESIIGSVRGERNAYMVSLAYKSALIIAYKNGYGAEDVATRFLYDDYPAEVKVAAATLMWNIDRPKSNAALSYWIHDVETSIGQFRAEAERIASGQQPDGTMATNNRSATAEYAEMVENNLRILVGKYGITQDWVAYRDISAPVPDDGKLQINA